MSRQLWWALSLIFLIYLAGSNLPIIYILSAAYVVGFIDGYLFRWNKENK